LQFHQTSFYYSEVILISKMLWRIYLKCLYLCIFITYVFAKEEGTAQGTVQSIEALTPHAYISNVPKLKICPEGQILFGGKCRIAYTTRAKVTVSTEIFFVCLFLCLFVLLLRACP
jgi:hypothetical protein